ncbi:hypothetical protein NX059_010021 [Plenodomus lindquistii]|nr:hypothetical protein NX059_010021 [Plenodomus lindquistii]
MRPFILKAAIAAASPMVARRPTIASLTGQVLFLDILSQINASTPLNWTLDGNYDVAGRMTFVDIDTWNNAKGALESTAPPSVTSESQSNDTNPSVQYHDMFTLSDNIHLDLYCGVKGTHVPQVELYAFVSVIEAELYSRSGHGSYTWGYDDPSDTRITLWYNANIQMWDDTVHAGLIREMFQLGIMFGTCLDSQGLARGATVKGRHIQLHEEVVMVEAYAMGT